MARKANPLTDVAIRNAKPAEKPRKLFDGGGLYLEIAPSGAKLWRFKYQSAGKAKLLAMGQWPETSLSAARWKREEARELLARGIDPSEARKAEKLRQKVLAENTFEAIARAWERRYLSTRAQTHRDKVMRRLEEFKTPVLKTPARWEKLSMISAISARERWPSRSSRAPSTPIGSSSFSKGWCGMHDKKSSSSSTTYACITPRRSLRGCRINRTKSN
jgi:hypothetical protein